VQLPEQAILATPTFDLGGPSHISLARGEKGTVLLPCKIRSLAVHGYQQISTLRVLKAAQGIAGSGYESLDRNSRVCTFLKISLIWDGSQCLQ